MSGVLTLEKDQNRVPVSLYLMIGPRQLNQLLILLKTIF